MWRRVPVAAREMLFRFIGYEQHFMKIV